ncbi:MAG: SAM-dependent methyltransferase [Pseudanabaena sp. ELA607]
MKLNEVVPWGRTLAEYQLMFALSEADLNKSILGCGDGPASFNAEMTAQGYSIISIDPIYQFTAAQIRQRVQDTSEIIISQAKQNLDRYIWRDFKNPEQLGQARLGAMEKFLLDYEVGKLAGRYQHQALPKLEFTDQQFELCLCSHLLFLYSEHLSLEFHLMAIKELVRVAREVRIFPLVRLDGEPSDYVEPVLQYLLQNLLQKDVQVQIRTVAYEFQKGGNQMLQIKSGN